MKKRIFIAVAMLAGSIAFAQQKKEKQPPPPPPPPQVLDVKDIPPPPPPPETPPKLKKEYDAFLKRNPTVKGIAWSNDTVRIRLKSGKEEIYNMKNEEEALKLKSKYGELPAPTPPPPPPPKVIKEKTVS
jgi:hypothetical protein